MRFETERLIVMPFTEANLTPAYRSWFHDPKVTYWNSHGLFPYTKAQSEAFFKKITEGSASSMVFAIYLKGVKKDPNVNIKNTVHIGNAGIDRIDHINRSAELTWVIGDTEHWGKGIATEVGELLLKHCFLNLNINRVWTGTVQGNVGMRRALEKLGFMEEGRFKQGVFLRGEYHDVVCYATFFEDWRLKQLGVPSKVELRPFAAEAETETETETTTPKVDPIVLEAQRERIIDAIQEQRAGNNKNWMSLLKIAMRVAPEEAKQVFDEIAKTDRLINRLSEELTRV